MDTSKNSTNQITVIQKWEEIPIVCGPSWLDLCIAYAYAFNEANPHRASFTLGKVTVGKMTMIVRAQVIGLEYESGAEGMFNIKANFYYLGRDVQATGFYDAKRQKGYFRIPRS